MVVLLATVISMFACGVYIIANAMYECLEQRKISAASPTHYKHKLVVSIAWNLLNLFLIGLWCIFFR
jgi:hypothetical protein